MADNYLQFSFVVKNVTPEGFAYIEELFQKSEDDEEETPCRYEYERGRLGGDPEVWFCAEENGNPDALANILSDYLKAYDPPGRIAFTWAVTCSKMRLDEFGGGGVVITADEVRIMDAYLWTERTV